MGEIGHYRRPQALVSRVARGSRMVRAMRRARRARRPAPRGHGTGRQRALPFDANRRLAEARVRKAAHAGTRAHRVGLVARQRAAITTGAVIREQPAVSVGSAVLLCAARKIGDADAQLRRPVEAADTQHRVDARLRGRAHLLGAGVTRVRADATALVAADVITAAQHVAARHDARRALEATVVWTDGTRRAGRTHRPTPGLSGRLRDPAAGDLAVASVGRSTPDDLHCQDDQSSRHQRPRIQDRSPPEDSFFSPTIDGDQKATKFR